MNRSYARAAAAASSLTRDLPLVLLWIAIAESIVLLLSYGSGLTFFQDEWDFLIHRRGLNLHAFLAPDNEHISVFAAAVFKILVSTFGMSSTAPFRVVATLLLAATAVLLFVYLRRLVGDWLALGGALLVLFLGPAWQTLLLPVEMARIASLVAGLGMLLALRRHDRSGDRLACALLTASVLAFSLGVCFIVAAAVDVALRRDSRRRRLFIPAIPLGVYLLWYVTYGHAATSNVSLHNVVTSPLYLAQAVASALQALLGFWPTDALQPDHPTWGWGILALVLAAAVVHVRRTRRVGPQLWPVLAAAVCSWLLGGATYLAGRAATESRFQYTSVVFVLLLLAELFPGIRLGRLRVLAAVAVAAFALTANLSTLARGRDYLRAESALTRADLGALELTRRTVAPNFTLTPAISGTRFLTTIDARSYLSAVDAYGSPADRPSELAAAPAVDRAWADVVLGHALPVSLMPARARTSCAVRSPGSGGRKAGYRIGAGRTIVKVAPGQTARLRLRRFATRGFPVSVGSVRGGTAALLDIPADRSTRPWHLHVDARQAVALCRR